MSLTENGIALFSDIVQKNNRLGFICVAKCAAATTQSVNWASAVWGAYLLSVEDFNTLKLNAFGYESTGIITILFTAC